ncbi:hypothetical protein GALMADRAFT_146394 [Galerina marginata CBS 339.88]|uniref:F-box domain-containing protein n=1 Tax=Galerina marginata (strain CBS 339.88) TaxID=685588 RepID=A0A067SEQ3_GALM3|nr:hypothetical protein GALMADRAFT_146394 [Galerina marginata CBS 339.88]
MPTAELHTPVEVVEVVIDHLYNDTEALRACSLVARAWLPTSRYHLIPSVRVHLNNYEELLRLLAAPETRIALSVRHLMLARLAERENGWMNEVIPTLAKSFASITSLSLIGVKWRHLNPLSDSHLRTSFQKAKNFLLLDCNFSSLLEYLEVLCSFKIAEHLNIVMCNWNSGGHILPAHLTTPPSLRNLLIDGIYQPFLWWIVDQKHLRLEHFLVDEILASDLENIKTILYRVGSTLRHLQLRYSDTYLQLPSQPGPGLDLSQNTSLEKFKLTIGNPFSMYTGFPLQLNLSFVLPLLQSISSPCLHELRFRILVCSPGDLVAVDWYGIDNLAGEKVWGSSLTRVLIELTDITCESIPENFMEEAKAVIYPGLHYLATQGLLDVRFKPLPETPETIYALRQVAFKGLPLPRQ